MPKSKIGYIAALVMVAVLASSAYAITFQATTTPDLRPKAVGADVTSATVVIQPYIQNVSSEGVTICWQTDVPSFGEVIISDRAPVGIYRTPKARRYHEVRVRGLDAGSAYSYQVRVSVSADMRGAKETDLRQFETFPTNATRLKILVYGDTRSHPDRHAQVIDAMSREKDAAFILHTGDVVDDGRNFGAWIPQLFEPAGKLMATKPIFAVLGNHERGSPYFYQYFDLPDNEQWYSFDCGPVHIIALDSNVAYDPGSKQYSWLVADLEANKNAKWKFVFMHHPTYTSGNHGSVDEKGVPKEKGIRTAQMILPRLAAKYGITAVFAGHDHAYECSVRDGVNYVIAGGGGAPNYGDPNAKNNPYRKVFYSGLHYCIISINGNQAEMTVKTPEGEVLDQVRL